MLYASLLSHTALGALCSLIFVLYYINGDSKWKVYLEILIGIGGNGGSIFILDRLFNIKDIAIRMYSISACIFSFLIITFILLLIMSYVIKDKDDRDILRLRDILLGQTSWVKKYYEKRANEIDTKLNIASLQEREEKITKNEHFIEEEKKYLNEERDKIQSLGKRKLQIELPEHKSIILTPEFIEVMPSYINDVFNSINNITHSTNLFIEKANNHESSTFIISYLISLATSISQDLFGGKSSDIRIHFRIYNPEKDGYEKLIAMVGEKVINKDLTFIPYSNDSMIKKSFECKRALIKSINSNYDYQSNNHTYWQDYMTFTFYNLKRNDIPFLSFGISVKNQSRYKKIFYFLNYFKWEYYLQDNIERLNEVVDFADSLYGGSNNDKNCKG